MPLNTIYKTVRQYNKFTISEEEMKKLVEVANDYSRVKNYVYQRYGSIKSLSKIYPGYTVQNEMTKTGFRAELGLPSVYFYLAIFDALGDIKMQWTQTKTRILQSIKKNQNLTADDRHYLRFVLKVSSCLECILTNQKVVLKDEIKTQYQKAIQNVDVERINNYLCRQVRKHLKKIHTDKADGFFVTERAYRYGDHGIYISTKEKRKRIFVPLTDSNQYKSQIYIHLYPEEGNIVIGVPIEMKVKQHEDYVKIIGLALGVKCMFVTDEGHEYGEQYEEYQFKLNQYVSKGMSCYRRNQKYNSGRKKYYAGKARLEAELHTYINKEINHLFEEERPETIYIPKLPQYSRAGPNKKINYSINMWQRGYIRKRLAQKCKEQSINLVEVFAKNISNECSQCGNIGEKKEENFCCPSCGLVLKIKTNTAKNVLKRGVAASNLSSV